MAFAVIHSEPVCTHSTTNTAATAPAASLRSDSTMAVTSASVSTAPACSTRVAFPCSNRRSSAVYCCTKPAYAAVCAPLRSFSLVYLWLVCRPARSDVPQHDKRTRRGCWPRRLDWSDVWDSQCKYNGRRAALSHPSSGRAKTKADRSDVQTDARRSRNAWSKNQVTSC